MNKNTLINSLKKYHSIYKEELHFKTQFLELLQEDNCFLRSRLAEHLTASCWVTNSSYKKVLLLHHKKLDKWLQPGGHADGNENLIQVAKKELNEETGLKHFRLYSTYIFDIDIHLIFEKKNIPEHFHYDVRFHFIAEKLQEIRKNHESFDLKWVNLEDATNICKKEKSIIRMVNKNRESILNSRNLQYL